jgi:predicted nucleic acid-binding protein
MFPSPFRVVVDANVLFPFTLRDTMLRAAARGLFQVYWSEQILEEARRNLLESAAMTEEQAERLMATMRRAFPEATVHGHESLIDGMPNDPKDRHVAAVAVKAGAQVIVTRNLKDFASLPEGIDAQSPDAFLESLVDLDRDGVVALVVEQAAALQKPARTVEEILSALGKMVPEFVQALREHLASSKG